MCLKEASVPSNSIKILKTDSFGTPEQGTFEVVQSLAVAFPMS